MEAVVAVDAEEEAVEDAVVAVEAEEEGAEEDVVAAVVASLNSNNAVQVRRILHFLTITPQSISQDQIYWYHSIDLESLYRMI